MMKQIYYFYGLKNTNLSPYKFSGINDSKLYMYTIAPIYRILFTLILVTLIFPLNNCSNPANPVYIALHSNDLAEKLSVLKQLNPSELDTVIMGSSSLEVQNAAIDLLYDPIILVNIIENPKFPSKNYKESSLTMDELLGRIEYSGIDYSNKEQGHPEKLFAINRLLNLVTTDFTVLGKLEYEKNDNIFYRSIKKLIIAFYVEREFKLDNGKIYTEGFKLYNNTILGLFPVIRELCNSELINKFGEIEYIKLNRDILCKRYEAAGGYWGEISGEKLTCIIKLNKMDKPLSTSCSTVFPSSINLDVEFVPVHSFAVNDFLQPLYSKEVN